MAKGKLFRKINSLGCKTENNEIKRDPKLTLLGSFSSTFTRTMTLHTLQDKIKRQPEMYRKEFA